MNSTGIHELSLLEQNIQSLLMQRQATEIELGEVGNALSEVKSATEDVYRVISGIMMKANKEKILEELNSKKKMLDLRAQTIEKQQKLMESKAEEIRREVMNSNSENTGK